MPLSIENRHTLYGIAHSSDANYIKYNVNSHTLKNFRHHPLQCYTDAMIYNLQIVDQNILNIKMHETWLCTLNRRYVVL